MLGLWHTYRRHHPATLDWANSPRIGGGATSTHAFELFGAAYGIGAATIVGLPAAVGASVSGSITADAGIVISLGITFIYTFIVIAGAYTIKQSAEAIIAFIA